MKTTGGGVGHAGVGGSLQGWSGLSHTRMAGSCSKITYSIVSHSGIKI